MDTQALLEEIAKRRAAKLAEEQAAQASLSDQAAQVEQMDKFYGADEDPYAYEKDKSLKNPMAVEQQALLDAARKKRLMQLREGYMIPGSETSQSSIDKAKETLKSMFPKMGQ